ncbi:MAG: TRAM domain-containing protein, partial [Actinomycetes bacterium]
MSGSPTGAADGAVGSSFEVRVGAVAHGGHCVARHEGRVVFVRHALPDELVRVVVTDGGPHSSYWRADAVEVLEAGAGRVAPPCPWAGPGRCGG